MSALRDALLSLLARRLTELEARDGSDRPPPSAAPADPLLAPGGLAELDALARPFARRLYRRVNQAARAAQGAGGDLTLARLTFVGLVGDVFDGLAGGGPALELACTKVRRHLGPRRLRAVRLPLRAPLASLLAFLVVATGGATIAWSLLRHRAVRPHGFYATGAPPPAADEAHDRLFGKALPAFVTALSRRAGAEARGMPVAGEDGEGGGATPEGEVARARAALEAAASFDGPLAQAIGDLAHDGAALETTEPGKIREDVAAIDDVLVREGAPYFVDAALLEQPSPEGAPIPLLVVESYRVVHASLYRVDGEPIRVLRLRRLDALATGHSLLGYTRPDGFAALVLEDRVDSLLLDRVVPALAENAAFPLVPAHGASFVGASQAAGRALRRELDPLLAKLPEEAQAVWPSLLDGLAQRSALLDRLRAALPADATLDAPSGLVLSDEDLRALATVGTPPFAQSNDWGTLVELNGELTALAARPGTDLLVDRLADALAADLARHEAIHRYDDEAPPHVPAELVALLPDGADLDHANRELSAYTAELAQEESGVGAILALLAPYLLDPSQSHLDEATAALVLVEGLAGHSLRAGDGRNAHLDRDAAAQAFGALFDTPPSQVRQRAQVVYRQLFGRGAPIVEPATR